MNSGKISVRRASFLLASTLVGLPLFGATEDAQETTAQSSATAGGPAEPERQIAELKAALAAQEKQLQALEETLRNEQEFSTPMSQHPNLGNIASLTPVMPAPAALPTTIAFPNQKQPGNPGSGSTNPCEAAPDTNAVPPYLRLGSVCIVPIGFMDLTPFWRDKNAGSGMGSNFGSIPFNNTANGNLSETRFSIQNSRLGLRVDGDWKGAHFIGYNEFDFNGTSGSSSLAVSNGAVVPRLRLFWVDVRRDKWEFLAGQSWSMLVPNRRGISALPGDLFYTQVIDINYMAGLTWSRQPGLRVLFHPGDKVTFGFSAEQPDQYIGGSAGGGAISLPSAYSALAGTQLDQAQNITLSSYLGQPAVTPDFIVKMALDPTSRFHFDITGIESNFKTVNPALLSQHFTTRGEGLQFGINAEIVKNFRVISTNFFSNGEGRYLFGQAPDIIVRGDGSLSPVRADGTIDGVEATAKNTLLYAYYGGIYIGRNAAVDANGKSLIGYGYSGSPNSQNRAIDELTFGFNRTIWRNPRYGAFNLMGQYEWLERDPWFVAAGAPKNTHDNTVYFNVRYTLPGSMPNF